MSNPLEGRVTFQMSSIQISDFQSSFESLMSLIFSTTLDIVSYYEKKEDRSYKKHKLKYADRKKKSLKVKHVKDKTLSERWKSETLMERRKMKDFMFNFTKKIQNHVIENNMQK